MKNTVSFYKGVLFLFLVVLPTSSYTIKFNIINRINDCLLKSITAGYENIFHQWYCWKKRRTTSNDTVNEFAKRCKKNSVSHMYNEAEKNKKVVQGLDRIFKKNMGVSVSKYVGTRVSGSDSYNPKKVLHRSSSKSNS